MTAPERETGPDRIRLIASHGGCLWKGSAPAFSQFFRETTVPSLARESGKQAAKNRS
ncbi:MAG: hypothetical protein OHK005_18360 [Candidatus Methylacidiphilales bacterium]